MPKDIYTSSKLALEDIQAFLESFCSYSFAHKEANSATHTLAQNEQNFFVMGNAKDIDTIVRKFWVEASPYIIF